MSFKKAFSGGAERLWRTAAKGPRQIMLLLDGSFAVTLLHRDPSYMESAGDAAFTLLRTALLRQRSNRRQAASATSRPIAGFIPDSFPIVRNGKDR